MIDEDFNITYCTLLNFKFVGLENANEILRLDSNKRYKVNYYPKRQIDKRLSLIEIKEEIKQNVTIDKKVEIVSLEDKKQDIMEKIQTKAEISTFPQLSKNSGYYMKPITTIQNFDEDDYKIWKLYSVLQLLEKYVEVSRNRPQIFQEKYYRSLQVYLVYLKKIKNDLIFLN